MKENIIQKYFCKLISSHQAASDISMHEKSFLRLVGRYKRCGSDCLIPRKPWPKSGSPDNRTPDWIEAKVENLARCNPHLGPVPLAWKLEKEENIRLNATTIWRILKRRKVRYGTNYSRYKEDSKLYELTINSIRKNSENVLHHMESLISWILHIPQNTMERLNDSTRRWSENSTGGVSSRPMILSIFDTNSNFGCIITIMNDHTLDSKWMGERQLKSSHHHISKLITILFLLSDKMIFIFVKKIFYW